jgi:uncharacterized protein
MQLHSAAARGDIDGIADTLRRGAKIDGLNGQKQTALVFALERKAAFARRAGPTVTIDAVRSLVDAGINLEAEDHLGTTAIHHAARVPDVAFLDDLLERGANALHVSESKYSVLLSACFQPGSAAKRDIVQRLVQKGCSLDLASSFGESPLGVCLRFGDFGTMKLLLELGADSRRLQWNELHHAVAFGNLSEVRAFSRSREVINSLNDVRLSPWLLAFKRGDLAIATLLAERGADLLQRGWCGTSPLHIAAEFDHASLIGWMVELGADVNALDDFGGTPLHRACSKNHIETVRILLEAGADINQPNETETAVHSAWSIDVLELLRRFGADLNSIDGCGDWPLKAAAENNDAARVSWLLARGAEVDRTSTGETALHGAVRNDSREVIDVLLAAGANPNAQDVDGWTPVFAAESEEVIRRLKSAGADFTITDQTGWGPERWLSKDEILIAALRGH